MPRRPRKRPSNFTSTANNVLRLTGKLAAKSFHGIAKQNAMVAADATRHSNLIELMQRANFALARQRHTCRKSQQPSLRLLRCQATGHDPSLLEETLWWVPDCLMFLWDLLWGFFEPILMMLMLSLLRVALIIVFNVIYFGAIYLWLRS